MATLIEPSISTDSLKNDKKPADSVVITDMLLKTNEHNDSTLSIAHSKADQLKHVDTLFGPLQLGEVSITRVSLDALGATIDGQPLNGQNTFFRRPRRSLINSLQFSAEKIESLITTSTGRDGYLLSTLLFELASQRPLTAPALIREPTASDVDLHPYRGKLAQLLDSAQKLDLGHARMPRNNSRWAAAAKSYAALGSSIGIQGFGIFMGLRGVVDAIKTNNTTEVVINSAGIGTEVASIATDVAVNKIATQMLTAGQNAYKDFAKTRFAVRLGRSGGLIGGVLTLPFDIFTAVRSLNAAENATGKEAMDHYVSAGLSIASAAMTVILGAAAMAGFAFAGPVGLAAGAILAIGSQVYGAVRIVDDIDDYIELSVEERWRSGWFSFCMMDVDQDVQDRYSQAKAMLQHTRQAKETARKLLDGALKGSTEAIVNGKTQVHLEPTEVWTRNWWTKQDSWKTVKVPVIKGADDTIDARAGVTTDTPGAELGTAAGNKGVLWLIGDGRDSIQGVEAKPNAFHYKSGRKELTGGDKDDRFVFEGAADHIRQRENVAEYSKLKGGAGNDTLVLGGVLHRPVKPDIGYDVDLSAGTLHTVMPDAAEEDGKKYIFHSLIESIENVETVDSAASTVVGTSDRNIIKSRGFDTITAGGGNDQIYLLHCGAIASGEAGSDEYFIDHQIGHFSIIEDGRQPSHIVLNWAKDLIESWKISNGSLVITSTFDYSDRQNVVTIHGVYEKAENKYKRRNNNLTFLTRDDFHLKPVLPEMIEPEEPVTIDYSIIKYGNPRTPSILYQEECRISLHENESYFIPRSRQNNVFYSTEKTDTVTRIYLDYASDELTKVEENYTARQSETAKDLMVKCDLVYHFGNKTVTLFQLAFARGGTDPMNMEKILRAIAYPVQQKYVIIFNDGVAANATISQENYLVPEIQNYGFHKLTTWTHVAPLPLKMRSGKYFFELPENEAHAMSSHNECAELFSSPRQIAVESLEGNGSTYLIHLVADMTIRLSTPGALANAEIRLPYSSLWELDATKLGKVDISLENSQLRIGTCVIHLPVYESEDLIDQIRVITEHGVVHTVDLSFDRVYLDGIDGRFFTEPDASKGLPEALLLMANAEMRGRHIVAAYDGQAVNYKFPAHGWVLSRDKSRIESSELRVLNQCVHQSPYLFKPRSLITVPPA
ncbi:calcium-binding protein [Pseudomonas sp. Marseille-Q5117]|uniref:calcium-binding protein n=1 Tax=Pseudomonas sp. Marseille-Q5117 TaxID=2972777 RepID=UPI0021C9CD81|nr:calcium-binding protein [Pseudomonas sp. Marseille-Q5117]